MKLGLNLDMLPTENGLTFFPGFINKEANEGIGHAGERQVLGIESGFQFFSRVLSSRNFTPFNIFKFSFGARRVLRRRGLVEFTSVSTSF
jgi:hypothetical protein